MLVRKFGSIFFRLKKIKLAECFWLLPVYMSFEKTEILFGTV